MGKEAQSPFSLGLTEEASGKAFLLTCHVGSIGHAICDVAKHLCSHIHRSAHCSLHAQQLLRQSSNVIRAFMTQQLSISSPQRHRALPGRP